MKIRVYVLALLCLILISCQKTVEVDPIKYVEAYYYTEEELSDVKEFAYEDGFEEGYDSGFDNAIYEYIGKSDISDSDFIQKLIPSSVNTFFNKIKSGESSLKDYFLYSWHPASARFIFDFYGGDKYIDINGTEINDVQYFAVYQSGFSITENQTQSFYRKIHEGINEDGSYGSKLGNGKSSFSFESYAGESETLYRDEIDFVVNWENEFCFVCIENGKIYTLNISIYDESSQ